MKKLVFLNSATDKYTGEDYKIGATREFEDARAEEIVKTGLATYVKEEKQEQKAKEKDYK